MRRFVFLATFLTIIVCQATAADSEQAVAGIEDSKDAELNALLAADSSTGVHDNQSGREARQFGFGRPYYGGGFGSPFGGGFGRPFGGGGFGRPFGGGGFGGGFGRRRIIRRHRGGFFG